jgi:hypothetical protein
MIRLVASPNRNRAADGMHESSNATIRMLSKCAMAAVGRCLTPCGSRAVEQHPSKPSLSYISPYRSDALRSRLAKYTRNITTILPHKLPRREVVSAVLPNPACTTSTTKRTQNECPSKDVTACTMQISLAPHDTSCAAGSRQRQILAPTSRMRLCAYSNV